MKIVFIAGPYRGDRKPETIEKNIATARVYQRALAEAGITAYSPNVHDAYWEELSARPKSGQRTLKMFTDHMLRQVADALVVMPGWETSAGTQVEIAWAKEKGMPTFFLRSPEDLDELKAWYNS